MTPRLRPTCVFFALLLATGLAAAPAPSDTTRAAYLLVLGRAPTSDAGAADMAAAFATAREQLQGNAGLQTAVAAQARADAFGGAEVDAPAATALTYAAQVTAHLAWLDTHPDANAQVLQQAYRYVINRDVYEEELAYWNEQPARYSYVMLVACIEDWARRNQPGLMVTAGTPTVSINCEFLTAARLSPADAAVARKLIGLGDITTPGYHVVAPGAAHLKSAGGIHFVAAGATD
ncbi:hypothetical protein [Actomonas aquatica]|uniref:Uncharacterized protein n=1 Tax=Actomonas aquatica TaxID=2866162 RepID=A0ABZ1C990_9BACT|nr:hypothetical protein [Opitutus sp. WL0086]WRQ87977.1 hypothetical protein K1X11_001060 [Opitutus sp. WL0086]